MEQILTTILSPKYGHVLNFITSDNVKPDDLYSLDYEEHEYFFRVYKALDKGFGEKAVFISQTGLHTDRLHKSIIDHVIEQGYTLYKVFDKDIISSVQRLTYKM